MNRSGFRISPAPNWSVNLIISFEFGIFNQFVKLKLHSNLNQTWGSLCFIYLFTILFVSRVQGCLQQAGAYWRFSPGSCIIGAQPKNFRAPPWPAWCIPLKNTFKPQDSVGGIGGVRKAPPPPKKTAPACH